MIFCVRGRCPGPLDECGIVWFLSDTFSVESECKSTNIFRTDKIFFQTFSHFVKCQSNKFSSSHIQPHAKRPSHPYPQPFFTPSSSLITQHSNTPPKGVKFGPSHIVPIYFSYTSYITYIRSI